MDGSGFVDKDELRQMASNLGYEISEDELTSLMKEMDHDDDGKIDFQEFIAHNVCIFFFGLVWFASASVLQPRSRFFDVICCMPVCVCVTPESYMFDPCRSLPLVACFSVPADLGENEVQQLMG